MSYHIHIKTLHQDWQTSDHRSSLHHNICKYDTTGFFLLKIRSLPHVMVNETHLLFVHHLKVLWT